MFEQLIGRSPNVEALLRNARMVAKTNVTILIVGETGTGKEVLAHALQRNSPRADKPFINLNCAALPEHLVESELFGHQKGAFTNASNDQIGRLQAADGGTVLLDEVDSLPLPIQAKLLRFLELGEIQPIGETKTRTVDVRVLAASNANLQERIAQGTFRKDLYHRLSVVPLEIPPLRKRDGDVKLLLDHFLRKFELLHGLPKASFSEAAQRRLLAYPWPGNVRELRNLCERLLILFAGRTIDEHNLPRELLEYTPARAHLFELPEQGIDLEKMEMDLIQQALALTKGNRSKSARLLGLTRDTFLYRMNKFGLS